ncbi:hypothetical protein UFOVP804_29 [uncultured Caudovirales phage]|uniref:Uncharacterized protein n=1 Tax=uncultured Caudovirales phage TaxID=2100421 RepID=A0A6J5NXN4_9CAUD|nr:hypothetical protein UFOVP804_29 [uncultured Caudovirales phage]
MKTVDTFIYVGGSLGLVGGHHNNPRLSFVRLSDYLELDAKVKRMAMDSLHDINHIAELQAEVERLTDAITKGAMTPDAKPFDEVERLKEEIQVLQNRCDFLEGRGQP